MRKRVDNVIDEDDVNWLKAQPTGKHRTWDSAPLKKVLAHIDATPTENSYWRVESKPQGHGWHIDTGSKKHMLWCRYGASVLLSKPDQFTGGTLTYRDRKEDKIYRSAYIHSSDVEHMVTPHEGKRTVLLLFI
jgi:hypothetical protein